MLQQLAMLTAVADLLGSLCGVDVSGSYSSDPFSVVSYMSCAASVSCLSELAHSLASHWVLTPCSVPLYYELKLVGLLWLMTPQTKGAQLLYEKFINPFLTQHAAKFDPVFATTKLVSDLQH